MKRTLLVLLFGLVAVAPATAQRTPPALPPRVAFRPVPRPIPEPAISFRPLVFGTEEAFAAAETFKAVFGKNYAPFFGGGLQVVFHGRYYVEIDASRSQQTGQRVFRNNGQNFSLGIPLTATVTPVEITGGYRFRLKYHPKVRPYVGAGVGWYGYTETSDFSTTTESLDTQKAGVILNGGVEFRVHKWAGLAADVAYSHVTGILGTSGISKDIGDNDLGGVAARVKLIVGR